MCSISMPYLLSCFQQPVTTHNFLPCIALTRSINVTPLTRSINYPDNIAAYYLDSVKELGGCPRKLNTDLGTENGTMAGIHCFFMNDEDSHQYVASPENQRIEV